MGEEKKLIAENIPSLEIGELYVSCIDTLEKFGFEYVNYGQSIRLERNGIVSECLSVEELFIFCSSFEYGFKEGVDSVQVQQIEPGQAGNVRSEANNTL